MTIQPRNNNLDYIIDPAFTKVKRLFVLSFERIEGNNVKINRRDYFLCYHLPNFKIKNFIVLIDRKSFS